jgi:hypothetical protein
MSKSKQTQDPNDDKREDFELKVWFLKIKWGRLTLLGLCALVVILIFVLLMAKL